MLFGRSLLGAAVIVYLVVLGCVALTGAGPGATSPAASSREADSRPKFTMEGLPYRGAAIQIQRVDWIDKYKQSVDEIVARGFDTVSFVVDSRQENGTSSHIYLDMRMTPTPEKLAELIQHAKSKKLRVILMPIVLLDAPRGNEWRGSMKPESWKEWFASYRDVLTHFAWIAEQNKVDILTVGSELVTTENKVSEWRDVIKHVRSIYHGRITYSANWDHYTSVPFWDDLDLIGLNSYYNLGELNNERIDRAELKVDDIVKRWGEIQQDLVGFAKKEGKPILFLEIGWCSLANAAHEPWDYTQTALERDDELQKMLYEGFFQAWYSKPELGGFIVWEWAPGDGGKGESEQETKGYTPENKPAEQVIKDWLAKPWGNGAVRAE